MISNIACVFSLQKAASICRQFIPLEQDYSYSLELVYKQYTLHLMLIYQYRILLTSIEQRPNDHSVLPDVMLEKQIIEKEYSSDVLTSIRVSVN